MGTERLSDVVVIDGDKEIARILAQEGAIVYPAYYGRYDGFANDVFSEYANPSIVRPRSVRQARLQSSVTVNFFQEAGDLCWDHPLEGQERLFHSSVPARLFLEPGTFHVGWTMYDEAGEEENVTAWLGARRVAYARSDDNDNRVHLYVLRDPHYIDDGERLRLVTDATSGAYRIENIVLLPALPQASERRLTIEDVSLEVDRSLPGRAVARLNWRTSLPCTCEVEHGLRAGERRVVREARPLQNHSLALEGDPDPAVTLSIIAHGERGEEATSGDIACADIMPAAGTVTAEGRIAFRLSNEAAAPAAAWPVTWGFPFPRGALWELGRCRLVGPDGGRIEAQKRVQVSWDDGSVRWALIDAQVDLPAEGLDLALEYGPAVDDPKPEGIAIDAGPDGVSLAAGALSLSVSRSRYLFPAEIAVRRGDGYAPVVGGTEAPAVVLVDADGKVYDRAEVESVDVEEAGPLRSVVKVALRHGAGDGSHLLRSVLRLTAYRGKPWLRVQHTFENDNTADLFTRIGSLTLNVPLPTDVERVTAGERTFDLSGGPVSLLQSFDDRFVVEQGGAPVASGEHAPASVVVRGAAATVALIVRDLWQNYPKGWQVNREGVSIGICPDVSAIEYPSGGVEEVRSFFCLQGGTYRFKRGMARTHDLLFSFAEDEERALAPLAQFTWPPLVRLEPRLLAETRALSRLSVRGEAGAEPYDRWTEHALDVYEADRRDTRAYGMLNYGDWFGERRVNWGDMEYDTPYAFILEYLRGGSSRYFTLGWEAAWHLADVDTVHYHPDPDVAGLQYLHSIGHVGDYYPEAYIPGAISQEAMSWSHTWVEGLYLYALLTGERRLLEAADRTVEILAGPELNHYDFTNCRDCGWPLRHLIGAYQATGRKQYLNGARIIVERVLERQRPTGGWERLMVPGHCFHVPPRHMGNAGFMVGVLLAALKRFHEETGDPRVGEAIVAGGGYLYRRMWEEGQLAFRYTACPQSKVDPELNTQVLEGIGYGWRLSGDSDLRHALVDGLAACLGTPHGSGTPPDGKDISMRMRSLPFIMADVSLAQQA